MAVTHSFYCINIVLWIGLDKSWLTSWDAAL
jgi:hypothetical protein